MILDTDPTAPRVSRADARPPRRLFPAPTPAQRPPHALSPAAAPVRPHEVIISATIHSNSPAGTHPAVLLAHDAGTIYLDTRAGRIELPASSGPARTAALAPGRIVIARRDALTLAAWRRTLTE